MFTIIKNRVIQLIVVLFILSLFTFTLMKMAPGDPVLTILNADEMVVTEEDQAELRIKLGFDQPLYIQYGRWMLNLMQFDLGKSYMTGKPVVEELLTRLPITAELTFFAMTLMLCITVPLGVWSAKYVNRWPDQFSRILALVGASIPSFWLGLILIYFFAFKLGVLPSSGIGSYPQIILPAFTLGFTYAVIYARLLRAGLLQSLSEDYVYAARARGVKEWRILWLHAFRPAILPVLTIFGLSLGSFLGGSVVVEILFSWPGLGSLAIDAILNRDYPVIQGYVLLTGVFVVLTNLIVDLSYYVIDPRMKRKEEAL
ncbi:nickel ABC transporter permease [Fictibacillus sp. 7GRE50]|uniref:nickel ABC transporter permease n=1 Tax=Fictibacillus sp. 7GRE50 TaxID=2745878 RepID=UPI00351C6C5D